MSSFLPYTRSFPKTNNSSQVGERVSSITWSTKPHVSNLYNAFYIVSLWARNLFCNEMVLLFYLRGSAAVCHEDLGERIRETGVVESYERSGLVDVSSQLEKLKHVQLKKNRRELRQITFLEFLEIIAKKLLFVIF